METCVLMGVLCVLINDYSTCCCYLLSIVVDFMILSEYTVLYFELADDIYSVPVFCTDPYLYVFLLLFVASSKRAVVFNSTASLASLHYTGFQGELMLLAWTGSSSSCLDALKFRHGLAFICFSFLEYS